MEAPLTEQAIREPDAARDQHEWDQRQQDTYGYFFGQQDEVSRCHDKKDGLEMGIPEISPDSMPAGCRLTTTENQLPDSIAAIRQPARRYFRKK